MTNNTKTYIIKRGVAIMKIVVIKSPKFISPILRFIFRIKKEQD